MDKYLKQLIWAEISRNDPLWKNGFLFGIALARHVIEEEAAEAIITTQSLHEALDTYISQLILPVPEDYKQP